MFKYSLDYQSLTTQNSYYFQFFFDIFWVNLLLCTGFFKNKIEY